MMCFEDYFTDERILHYVCRHRAKIAKRKNRQQLIYNVSGNRAILSKGQDNEQDELLRSILPPRRKWKKLDAKARTKANGQPLNSFDKIVRILKHTVRCFQRKNADEPFLKHLMCFCANIRENVMGPNPVLPAPRIIACRKKPRGTECRPIAEYPLAAKIAICLTNKYLSSRFDKYFEPCSFAFRMRETGDVVARPPTHHDAFAKIVETRRALPDHEFWMAECDIQKFYDTVNHSLLKKAFKKLVAKVSRAHSEGPLSKEAVRVFMAYLDSYSFNKNVLPLNDPMGNYFADRRMPGCKFAWVENELKVDAYRSLKNAKIGVPQGGALSGLIANILLDRVDKELVKQSDARLTYVRYCDDMIVMHENKQKCEQYLELYEAELKKMKLLPHEAKEVTVYNKEFWQSKSKRPYQWGPRGFVPWVGFVGYEVNAVGEVRVRKSSLAKEMQKQYETVLEVVRAIESRPRVSHKTIQESVANRLIQMSVGRARLHNFRTMDNELCWVNGFQLLTDNKYSRIQMKRLDACRNRLLWRLAKHLMGVERTDSPGKGASRQLVKYRKPFSYYFHAIEKNRDVSNVLNVGERSETADCTRMDGVGP